MLDFKRRVRRWLGIEEIATAILALQSPPTPSGMPPMRLIPFPHVAPVHVKTTANAPPENYDATLGRY